MNGIRRQVFKNNNQTNEDADYGQIVNYNIWPYTLFVYQTNNPKQLELFDKLTNQGALEIITNYLSNSKEKKYPPEMVQKIAEVPQQHEITEYFSVGWLIGIVQPSRWIIVEPQFHGRMKPYTDSLLETLDYTLISEIPFKVKTESRSGGGYQVSVPPSLFIVENSLLAKSFNHNHPLDGTAVNYPVDSNGTRKIVRGIISTSEAPKNIEYTLHL